MKNKTFEDKLMELEAIIAELENGTSTLDDSFKKYKKAMDLLKSCDEELKNVEEKVSKIVSSNGELENFEVEE
jgi:exodeoxyribonuclease VII small subunit